MKFKQRSRAWERNLGSMFSADRTASKKTLKLWIKPVVQVGRRGWMLEGQAETRAIRIQHSKSLDFVANITYTSTQLCTQLNLFHQPLEIKYRASTTCRKSICNYHYYCKISDGGKKKQEPFSTTNIWFSYPFIVFAFIYALCLFLMEKRKNSSFLICFVFLMFREEHNFFHLSICLFVFSL